MGRDNDSFPPPNLRIATAVYEPEVYPCSMNRSLSADPNLCPYPGIDIEILGQILGLMNISYELISYGPNVDWGSHVDNETSWTGLFGDVLDGTVDTVSSMYFITAERLLSFDFAYPVLSIPWVFISKKQSTTVSDSALSLFKVFTLGLWALMFGTVFLASLLLLLLQPVESRLGVQCNPWRLICNFFFQHSYDIRKTFRSTTFLFIIFILTAFFVTILYQNAIFTHLYNNHSPKAAFASTSEMVELIKRGHYSLLGLEGYAYFEELEVSDVGHYKAMREATRINPIIYEKNTTKMFEMLESGRYILPTYSTTALQWLQSSCLLSSHVNEDLEMSWMTFLFRKNSPWLEKFREGILSLDNYPLFVMNKYEKKLAPDCKNDPQSEKPLSFHSLVGVFLIFVGGLVISFVSFACERLYETLMKRGAL